MTLATCAVLQVLLDPNSQHFGLKIAKATGLPTGSVYPILLRLQQAGWLEGEWESIDPAIEQRPRRRFYELTPHGRELAWAALDTRPVLFMPGWNTKPGTAAT